jgi:hypothetical protein
MTTKPQASKMKPTKYELLIEGGALYLRGYSPETLKGYFNVESHKIVTGKSIPKLRKQGGKMAAHFGVPFVDRTAP